MKTSEAWLRMFAIASRSFRSSTTTISKFCMLCAVGVHRAASRIARRCSAGTGRPRSNGTRADRLSRMIFRMLSTVPSLASYKQLTCRWLRGVWGPGEDSQACGQMVGLPYHQTHQIAGGVSVTFLDAGHVLGSAIVVLDIEDEGRKLRLAFTGDLGRHHLPILRDQQVPQGIDCLMSESTYGDRLHAPIGEMADELAAVVCRTHARGGKIVIPSFALERTQEIVYELKGLRARKRIPEIPVYVDSPLSVKLTDVFRMHPECYDRDARELLAGQDSPFQFEGLKYVSEVEDSKAIDMEERPSIIISASGMCEAGRVLHHLRTTITDSKNTVVIVGFQAQYTLGRRIVERRREVRIFGVLQPLRAEVVVLDGFSAHADQKGLIDFAEGVRSGGPLRQIILVHGEPPAQAALARELAAPGFP